MEEVKRFDIKKVKLGSSVVSIGKRATGKSFLDRDILYHNRDLPTGAVVSVVDKCCHFYDKFISNELIYAEWNTDIMRRLRRTSSFLIVDNSYIITKEQAKEVLDCIKRSDVLCIMHTPTYEFISLAKNVNIDFTFIFKDSNKDSRNLLYRHYSDIFSTQTEFENILDKCTQDYHCLVIDNTISSTELKDRVFIYKAEGHEDFKMGCPSKEEGIMKSFYKYLFG